MKLNEGVSMRSRKSLLGAVSLGLVFLAMAGDFSTARAQESDASQAQPLIRGAVDDSARVTLTGNVYPMVRASRDLGLVDEGMRLERMQLMLGRSTAQERELAQFLADAHAPGNALHHQWLTPEEFGRRFGAADSDVETVKAWLESQGFEVNGVHPGRVAVEFSGTAGQVSAAFHTSLHRYALTTATGDTSFVANAENPQIPAALAGLVRGISPMHSLHAQPLVKVRGKTGYNGKTHQAVPEWTYPGTTGTVDEMTPADFAVQYDLAPVYQAGTTGTGQSIGILSASNVDLSLVAAYQKLFGLAANLPTVVVDGNDPGQTDAATEAYLDLEQALAVAPSANVFLYTSAGSAVTDPLLTAGLRALADNQVSVLSVSYGECEAALGSTGNAAWAALWQEAAAQGITVFVATGDGGSAGCDNFDAQGFAIGGVAVNGLSSTPYDVAVGGTDLYYTSYAANATTLDAQMATYWGAATKTATVSLLKPVPEQAWNDSFGLNAANGGVYDIDNSTILSGGGGASAAAQYTATGAVTGYAKPGWQAGAGVPADKVRDVPDVRLFAADGANFAQYPICALPGDCVNTNSAGAVVVTSVGGTSAAAPAMAAIQALVNQVTGSRQGQANTVYYALASKSLTAKPFRDVTVGGNAVPCYQGSGNCILGTSGAAKGSYTEGGYAAGTGYDRATGLGSVDVANLIANWAGVTFKATTTTLSVTPLTVVHGMPVTIGTTVAPKSGSGSPTGSVALESNDAAAGSNGLAVVNLKAGAGTGSVQSLPGGTYQLSAQYSGDGSFSGSTSAPVTVTVTPEKATLGVSGWVLNPLDGSMYPLQAGMWIPYGATLYLDGQITGVNEAKALAGQATPATGAVVFTDTVGTTSTANTVALSGSGLAEWVPGTLAVGSHVISASFAGDASYGAVTAATGASVNVFKGTTTMSLQPMETNVIAGSQVTVDLVMSSDYVRLNGSQPTGTIVITLGGQAVTVSSPFKSWRSGSGVSLEAAVTFSKVPAGILPLMATYSGDANWNASSALFGSVQSLASLPAPAVTLAANGSAFTPNQVVTLSGTVTGKSGGAAPSGPIVVTWENGAGSVAAALVTKSANVAAWTVNLPAWQLANGSNTLIATFGGDGNYSAQSSGALGITLNGGDFSLITTTPNVAVTPGTPASGTVLISPLNTVAGTFASAVTVSCAAPAGITCAVATKTLTVGAGVSEAITFTASATAAGGTFPAVITAVGGGHTHTAQILVANTAMAATPTFSPNGGTFTAAQTVTISDATAGATVYYTTDGTTPTAASTKYMAPITVGATETLKAVAMARGYGLSAVGSASFTVNLPAAAFPSNANTLQFPLTVVGATSAVQAVTFKNTGKAVLTITSFSIGGANASSFVISAKTCGSSLAAGASCTVSLAFKPSAAGTLAGQLVAHDNAVGGTQTVTLSGIGGSAAPALTVSPGTLTFAATKVGISATAQVVTLHNTGLVPVTLSAFTFSGTGLKSFALTAKTCGASLAAGASCTLSVGFKPTVKGALAAVLSIADNVAGSPGKVTLAGSGK